MLQKAEERKIRILYLSSVVPDKSCGARLVLFRHLVYKNDFEVAVASTDANSALTEEKNVILKPRIIDRLRKTRLSRFFANIEYFYNWVHLPAGLLQYARNFDPDVILTVPDNIHTSFALKLSRKLQVPLAVDYQDLFPLSQFIASYAEPWSFTRKFLLKKFHDLHQKADLVFYTSEGMQQWFGKHKNGHVLYPIGDFDRPAITSQPVKSVKKPITIVYAGNCYGAYGRMLLEFARVVKDSLEINLKIFPVGKGWSDEDIQEMTNAGIYQSFLPFEALKKEFEKADAFLTVMSFEKPEEPFVRTSFTTKWLDYAPYGKPIFVWGPDYSSGAIFASKYDCGIVVDRNKANDLRTAILDLAGQPKTWLEYGRNAKKASDTVLNPENIHGLLVREIHKLAQPQ